VLAAARRSNAALHRQKNPDELNLVDPCKPVIVIVIAIIVIATALQRIAIGYTHGMCRTLTQPRAFKRVTAKRAFVRRRATDWRTPGSLRVEPPTCSSNRKITSRRRRRRRRHAIALAVV
jgi:hypothetical protein